MPTFLLLAGLAAELYFLLGDMAPGRGPASAPAASAPPIGELVSRQNAVKIQNEGELIWEDTANKQTLYRRQSLLTLEDSHAEVAFLDGTGLMVDEKSLILLEKMPSDDSSGLQRIVVRLLHGTLHKSAPRKTSDLLRHIGTKTPEIEVDTGDSRIELSPASELTISSRPEDPEGAHVVVQSGEVKVESPHGAVVVKQGEAASVPKTGSSAAPVAKRQPFSLLSPKPGQTIDALAGTQPVRFRWNATREAIAGHPQEIEVSRDPEFKTGILKTRIPAAEPPLEYVEINLALPTQSDPAQWHWRVRAVDTDPAAAVSEPESFWIRPPTVPALRYPVDHAQAPAESTVDFSWDPFEAATGYELEIQGRAPIQTSESYARVQQLSPGPTSWRVRARLQDGGVSQWSVARELVIHEIPVAAPSIAPSAAAPDLTAPPPPEELEEPEIRHAPPAPKHTSLWDLWVTSALAAETPDADTWIVHLKWHAVGGVKKYKIQVSRDAHFKTVITESETSGAEWDWNFKLGMQNAKGKAYFRVASISAAGVTGSFSKAKPIHIPRSILRPEKAEVYSAKDLSSGAQAIEGADAAAKGDLDSLSPAKPALSKDLAGPRVGPPTAHPPLTPIPATRPPLRASPPAVRETELGVSSKPKDLPSEKPTSPAASVAKAPPAQPSDWRWNLEAALHTGYGSVSQSSGAPDLSSVGLQAPFLQQKFSMAADLTHLTQEEAKMGADPVAWLGELQFWFAGFQTADSSSNAAQASIKGFGFRLDVLRDWAKNAGRWNLYFGATLDRSYRWAVAANGQSVDTQGALSLGPSARAVRTYQYTGPLFSTKETGVALDLPVSGLLTSGQAGPELRIWGEWNLASIKQNALSLGLRAEAESSYLRWGSPSGTSTFAWTFWLAPTFTF